MITRFIFGFILFAGIVYYFDIDVRATVDKTGIPAWFSEHGFLVKSEPAATSGTATTSAAAN